MQFGIVILAVICGWAVLSIVVSLGFGEAAKHRDRVPLDTCAEENRSALGTRRTA